MIIAINGNRHQEAHLEDIDRLVTTFLRRDDTVVMTDRFLDYLTDRIGGRFSIGIRRARMSEPPEADLALAIGGDGALLKTAAWIGSSAIPVAGINTGHLGFLAAFSFDRPDELERHLLGGDYEVQPRALLQVQTPSGLHFALNEAAITRGENASMVTVDTLINGHHSLTYKGDGLIVATPTGSTAYNLSVGGPILDPSMAGWVISPIAAHSLAIRPLVVNDTVALSLDVTLRSDNFLLTIDGKAFTLPAPCRLNLSKAPFPLNLVTVPGHCFVDTLRSKLGLGN